MILDADRLVQIASEKMDANGFSPLTMAEEMSLRILAKQIPSRTGLMEESYSEWLSESIRNIRNASFFPPRPGLDRDRSAPVRSGSSPA